MHSPADDLLAAAAGLAWRESDGQHRTYGKLALVAEAGRWVITELEPQVAIRAKRIFPRLSATQVGSYTFVDSDETRAELEWFLERYPLDVTPADRARLAEGRIRFERIRSEIDGVLMPGWQPSGMPARLKEGVVLRPNQARAVEVAKRTGRLLVADDVGLGKTLAALAACMDEGSLPIAVICEAHVANQWFDDFVMKFTNLSAHIIAGTSPYVLPHRDVYIFKYSNAHGWVNVAETGRFRSVIFDEVQNLRHGRGTQKGQAADVFARYAGRRLGLSATPIFGYGGEIFNILDIIEPGILGTREEFIREWCKYGDDSKLIIEDPVALGSHLRDLNIMIREQGGGPPPNRIVVDVPYTGSETPAAKDRVKRAFMAGETDCIIMSLRSGAGLDGLQHRCATVVHGELDWSREVHKQLTGRLRPHARTDPITEIFIVADGGSDPLIASVQGLKASQARGIIDPKAGLEQVHSDESRIKALAKMYLEKGQ